jgi:RNA:NAD 2'-phosphotransferase (TPT1/KptA family)
MRLYHGTTRKRAQRIRVVGFVPRRSRVWFTTSLGYAKRRARTQARRAKDQAVTLTCDLDLGQFRARYGSSVSGRLRSDL